MSSTEVETESTEKTSASTTPPEKETATNNNEDLRKKVESHKRTKVDNKLKYIEKKENKERLISDLEIAGKIYESDDRLKNLLNKKLKNPDAPPAALPDVGIAVKDLKNKGKVIKYNFEPLKYNLKDAFTNEKIPNKFNNLKSIYFEVKGLEQKDDSTKPELDKNLLDYLNQPSSAKGGGKKNKTKKQKTTKNTKTRKKSK